MSIHPITTSFTPIALDTDSLKSSKISLDKLYSKLDKLYLQPLQQQINALKRQQRLVDSDLRDFLVTVPAELQLDSIKRLVADATGSPEGMDQYAAEITDFITDSLAGASNSVRKLSGQLDLLKNSTLSDVTDYIKTNEQQIQRQKTACQALETAANEMTAEKEVMNTAMRVMEDKTLWDEWLPLVRGIARLDPKNPARSAIQAAVTGVANIMRISGESVTYTHLVDARKILQGRLDSHYQSIGNYKEAIDQLNRQNVQLENIQAIAPHKIDYEVEVGKVATTLASFVSIYALTAKDNPLERARSYALQGDTLSRYLQDIRNELR
ncbi:MAG TPA: alpha-xenorhabdolysin family binary toxin subunit B [Pseudomonas sp.]|jgi:hypothetical protein|uniref:alpha-xenorhabdolysin family binary toxin subunit B n=1 Tax=Pseudomonas sp. TaxID=306 RepID=UPI002ED95BB3